MPTALSCPLVFLAGPNGQAGTAPTASWLAPSHNLPRPVSALSREHYLDGKPSGVWDQRTKNAMVHYQAENDWQTKIAPDSRALIKLGLGPGHEGLLNPDSAALGSPHELSVEPEISGLY